MPHAIHPLIHPHLARWTRRFLVGAALTAAIGAMVALAENGIPEDPLDAGLFPWVTPPVRYCQAMILTAADDPEAVEPAPAPGEDLEEDDFWDIPDPAGLPNPNGKIMTRCQVQGRCMNNGVEMAYSFDWCCFAGKGCFIKTGGAWVSLANWLQFGGGACIVQVGCK